MNVLDIIEGSDSEAKRTIKESIFYGPIVIFILCSILSFLPLLLTLARSGSEVFTSELDRYWLPLILISFLASILAFIFLSYRSAFLLSGKSGFNAASNEFVIIRGSRIKRINKEIAHEFRVAEINFFFMPSKAVRENYLLVALIYGSGAIPRFQVFRIIKKTDFKVFSNLSPVPVRKFFVE